MCEVIKRRLERLQEVQSHAPSEDLAGALGGCSAACRAVLASCGAVGRRLLVSVEGDGLDHLPRGFRAQPTCQGFIEDATR